MQYSVDGVKRNHHLEPTLHEMERHSDKVLIKIHLFKYRRGMEPRRRAIGTTAIVLVTIAAIVVAAIAFVSPPNLTSTSDTPIISSSTQTPGRASMVRDYTSSISLPAGLRLSQRRARAQASHAQSAPKGRASTSLCSQRVFGKLREPSS